MASQENKRPKKISAAGQDKSGDQEKGEVGAGREEKDSETKRAQGAEHGNLLVAGWGREKDQDQIAAEPD